MISESRALELSATHTWYPIDWDNLGIISNKLRDNISIHLFPITELNRLFVCHCYGFRGGMIYDDIISLFHMT